jgi:hypothetical protein
MLFKLYVLQFHHPYNERWVEKRINDIIPEVCDMYFVICEVFIIVDNMRENFF